MVIATGTLIADTTVTVDVQAVAPVAAALVAAAVAIYLNALGRKREEDGRRRTLYGQAFRTVLEWQEGVYRVRRRATDASQDQQIAEHFHELQERLGYYQGWLGTESWELSAAYRAFSKAVTDECCPLIQDAWAAPGRGPAAPTPSGDRHPKIDDASAQFLRDVRDHLSRWPWVRRRVRNRYEKAKA